jgi:hypothetical protein
MMMLILDSWIQRNGRDTMVTIDYTPENLGLQKVLSDCCGVTLRVYQPDGHYPQVYCPGCSSPYLVHCRDATGADVVTKGDA